MVSIPPVTTKDPMVFILCTGESQEIKVTLEKFCEFSFVKSAGKYPWVPNTDCIVCVTYPNLFFTYFGNCIDFSRMCSKSCNFVSLEKKLINNNYFST